MVELMGRGRLLAIAPNPSIDRLVEVHEMHRGEIHRPLAVTVVPGGKGFNVARVAATLGASVTGVGLLGGHAGRWIAEALGAEGIAVRAAWRQAETRTCTSVFDRHDGRTTEFYEPGSSLQENDWANLVEEIVSVASGGRTDLITVSGSLPPGAPDHGLAQIVEAAQSSGLRVAIDGYGAALRVALGARPWMVKINLTEAMTALAQTDMPGTPHASKPDRSMIADAATAVRSLVERGAERAIVTIGSAGSVTSLEDGSLLHIRPPEVGRYAVGAGDAFLAGVAVGVLRGDDPRAAVVRGTAAAAACSLVPGAGRLERETAERLIAEVPVEALE